MTKRADHVTETRQRIVEATVRLHNTIGLAATSIAAIAAEAGVTRLTVYRHFPELLELYEACSNHWFSRQQPPDPERWASVDDPEDRLRVGLADLYRFYRGGAEMLSWVHRDWHTIPDELRKQNEARHDGYRDVLLAPFVTTGAVHRRLAAVIGHAIAFPTWQSLCEVHGLPDEDAVAAMTTLALSVARQRQSTS